MDSRGDRPPRVCVFAPAPLLTVTIEQTTDHRRSDEIHLHAGGQGFWIAGSWPNSGSMSCCAGRSAARPGGSSAPSLARKASPSAASNRPPATARTFTTVARGERVVTATMPPEALGRHELDELYGIVLVEAFDSDVTVLGGPIGPPTVPPSTYRRLARDVRANGRTVVADLSGDPLRYALEGGLDVLKVSDEELCREGRAARDDADHRGAGDSLTAGVAATLADGGTLLVGLRLGAAAGALNVTRRGLATGKRPEIERLASHVGISRQEAQQ